MLQFLLQQKKEDLAPRLFLERYFTELYFS
jgi:hypothetical protein